MAKDLFTEPVAAIGRVHEYGYGHDGESHHHHAPPHYGSPEPAPRQHSVADAASVLGLPVQALTPAVVSAVTELLAELDRLRWHREQQQRREGFLEAQACRHSVAPVLNRRGFMRAVDGYLTGGEAHGTLVVLHAGGVERLVRLQGLAAGDGAVRHISANLVGAFRSSDVVGLISGSDFALLLPGTDLAGAHAKIGDVIDRINVLPFTWAGQAVMFRLYPGFHELAPGDDGETALAAADRTRRGLDGAEGS
jgi:GGDEF domain-containing protein